MASVPSDSDIEKAINEITKGSVVKQIFLGATAGVCSGLVFSRLGKVAALGIGGTLIFVAVANNQGWIQINWSAGDKLINKARKKIEAMESKKTRAKRFVKKNISLVIGFLGGFSIGVAL